jgi:hypothetical protein
LFVNKSHAECTKLEKPIFAVTRISQYEFSERLMFALPVPEQPMFAVSFYRVLPQSYVIALFGDHHYTKSATCGAQLATVENKLVFYISMLYRYMCTYTIQYDPSAQISVRDPDLYIRLDPDLF